MNRSRVPLPLCFVLLMLPLGGCSTAHRPFGPISAQERDAIAPYLRDGITTRADCIARFGNMVSVYDGGSTYVYSNVNFGPSIGFNQVVLCFDAQGVLSRHAIVLTPRELDVPDS